VGRCCRSRASFFSRGGRTCRRSAAQERCASIIESRRQHHGTPGAPRSELRPEGREARAPPVPSTFMLKEIHEQPRREIANTLQGGGSRTGASAGSRPSDRRARRLLQRTQNVQIVACGTSFQPAACARLLHRGRSEKIPQRSIIASAYRYRNTLVAGLNSLVFVTISQVRGDAEPLAACASRASRLPVHARHLQRPRELHWCAKSELVMLTRAGRDRRGLHQGGFSRPSSPR